MNYSRNRIPSRGEKAIKKSLQEKNFNFREQYSFPDCLSELGFRLFFDFGVLNESNNLVLLIEYQGYQHYTDGNLWSNIRATDKIKKEYCLKNNIPLLELFSEDIELLERNSLFLFSKINHILEKDDWFGER